MEDSRIEVHPREAKGKNANRRLRAQGQVPAVVYGGGKDPVPIQVERRSVEDLLKSAAGQNTVFLLEMAGTEKSRHAMIWDRQTDSVTGEMLHLDFQRVFLDQKVRVTVPVEVCGEALGVRNEGGMLDFVTRELEVECLPDRIPAHIELDTTELHIGQHVEAGQIELPEGVALAGDPGRVLVSVVLRRVAEEEEEEEEELLEAPSAEPEVVGRDKEEGEDSSS